MASPVRRPVGPTIRRNVDPDLSVDLTALHDELAIINIKWQQAYSDIAQTLKTAKDNNQALNSALSREINNAIELLMADMIRTVVGQVDLKRKNAVDDFEHEQKNKTARLI